MSAGAAKAASVLPRLTRSAPQRELQVQAEVREDLLDHRPLQDGRDDLQFSGAAIRAMLHVDVEVALFPLTVAHHNIRLPNDAVGAITWSDPLPKT